MSDLGDIELYRYMMSNQDSIPVFHPFAMRTKNSPSSQKKPSFSKRIQTALESVGKGTATRTRDKQDKLSNQLPDVQENYDPSPGPNHSSSDQSNSSTDQNDPGSDQNNSNQDDDNGDYTSHISKPKRILLLIALYGILAGSLITIGVYCGGSGQAFFNETIIHERAAALAKSASILETVVEQLDPNLPGVNKTRNAAKKMLRDIKKTVLTITRKDDKKNDWDAILTSLKVSKEKPNRSKTDANHDKDDN